MNGSYVDLNDCSKKRLVAFEELLNNCKQGLIEVTQF